MALPFGDYGQLGPNDGRIAPFLRNWLHTRFQALLLQGQPVFSVAGMAEVDRYQVISRTTADQLYTWLRHGLGYNAWTPREQRLSAALVLNPLRNKLQQQLADCGRFKHGTTKYATCQRHASIARREWRARQKELRVSADGIAMEVSG
jgi:hypothetical protein